MQVNSAIAPNSNLTGLTLQKNTANGWQNTSSWSMTYTPGVNYSSWNGDLGAMSIVTVDGSDYGFVSFNDNCRLKKQDGTTSSLFAVPAQKIVGGYQSGRSLTESNPNDFQNSLMFLAFYESCGSLVRDVLTFRNSITSLNFFGLKCMDFNGDGADDVMVTNWGIGQKPNFYIQENNTSLALVDPSRIPAASTKFNGAISIYEDIDGDGIPDLLYFPINGIIGAVQNVNFQLFKGYRSIVPSDRL